MPPRLHQEASNFAELLKAVPDLKPTALNYRSVSI